MKFIALIFTVSAVLSTFISPLKASGAVISGTVKADGKPVSGVYVSDGDTIVATDSKGHYRIKKKPDAETVFIITPSGFTAPSADNFQPSFWQLIEKPSDVDEKHDFILRKENQDRFSMFFIADLHMIHDSIKHDKYYYDTLTLPLARRIVKGREERGPVYAVNLGDFSHDLFWYSHDMQLDKVKEYVADSGFPAPVYSVPGNHDNDGAIVGKDVDRRAAWLYRKMLGPSHYSMNIGDTHWVMLDNIIYKNRKGRGKKNVGLKGDRSYDIGFTDEQLKWLKEDIARVPDTARIFICSHAPIVFSRETLKKPHQVDSLDKIFSRFDNVSIFSGHFHRNVYYQSEKFPRFNQTVIVATSGDMWQSSHPFRTLGTDGSEAGMLVADFERGAASPSINYLTYVPGDPLFRAYDLNSVGEYYRSGPGMELQAEIYPKRTDYSDPFYKDKVLVNFWGERDGRRIEVLEDGKPLRLIKSKIFQDPLYNVCHYVPKVVSDPRFNKRDLRLNNAHIYLAAPASPVSTLEIRVVDLDGNVIQSQTMTRPKNFSTEL